MKSLTEKQAFLLFLEHYGIEASIALGQNFLYEKKVLTQIAQQVCQASVEWVFEVGAGTGNLTQALLEQAPKVLSVEIDLKLQSLLKKRFKDENRLTLMFEDARMLNYSNLLSQYGEQNYAVCGNLPYYITTELILLLCTSLYSARHFVFLVQEEACDRIFMNFGTKSYGPLSIFLSNFFELKRLEKLPAQAFVPAPKIDSRLIQLSHLQTHPLELRQEDLKKYCTLAYFQFLKQAFQNRRKKLTHHLKILANQTHRNLSEYENFLIQEGFKLTVRAEELKPHHWLALYRFHLEEEEKYE